MPTAAQFKEMSDPVARFFCFRLRDRQDFPYTDPSDSSTSRSNKAVFIPNRSDRTFEMPVTKSDAAL